MIQIGDLVKRSRKISAIALQAENGIGLVTAVKLGRSGAIATVIFPHGHVVRLPTRYLEALR